MNIGTKVLLKLHEILEEYYSVDYDLWVGMYEDRKQTIDTMEAALNPSKAANTWKWSLPQSQIFYFERNLCSLLPQVLGDEPFIPPALPFAHGIVLYDMDGLGNWDPSFEDETVEKLPSLSAWWSNESATWVMHVTEHKERETIAISSGGWPTGQLSPGEDYLLAEVLRLILSKKTSTFRVRPDHDGSYKIAARTAELNPDGEGPHIVTLRALASQYRKLESHKEVDWKSRWWVRGHLRHLKSGNVTNVKPHIKGPKDRPLIQTIYDARR